MKISKTTSLKGTLDLPGDKSISQRAIIFGSILPEGSELTISNFLHGEDCKNTIKIFKKLGVEIDDSKVDLGIVNVKGVGVHGLKDPGEVLDVGNSGTAIRLLLGLLAGQKFETTITGDESIQKRPMKRVTEPLTMMGASFSADKAPITVKPGTLKGIKYKMPIASAQVKSAILLAAIYAHGETTVVEPAPARNHTENMLKGFGADIKVLDNEITLNPEKCCKEVKDNFCVPSDISSAAFFMVAGSIVPDSKIKMTKVGINKTRDGIIEVLAKMGGNIEKELCDKRNIGEPYCDVIVKTSRLKGITIEGDIIPRLIDELPIIAVAAACAEGKTVIKDAKELRVKESDRIMSICEMLRAFGVEVEEKEDGMVITPPLTPSPSLPTSGERGGQRVINSYGDHRIVMAAAVLGLAADGETIIEDDARIGTSFPGFEGFLKSLS